MSSEAVDHKTRFIGGAIGEMIAANIVLAAFYFGLAKLGLIFALVHGSVTLIWPPSGVAVAALTIWGNRLLPGLALGAFAANFTAGQTLLFPLATAFGNPMEAWLGALLLRRVIGFRPEMNRVRDILGLSLVAAPVSAAVTAAIGTGALRFIGSISEDAAATTWIHWVMGDAAGIIVVAPFLFALHVQGIPRKFDPLHALEGVLSLTAITFLGASLFGVSFQTWSGLPTLLLPLMLFVVFRFTFREVTLANVLLASAAALSTRQTLNAYSPEQVFNELLSLLALMLVSNLTTLLLAAVIGDRRRAEASLKQSLSLLQAVLESAGDGILAVERDGRVSCHNRKYSEIWGLGEISVTGRKDEELSARILPGVKAPDAFTARTRDLCARPETAACDLVALNDGRILECRSTPKREGNAITGRVYTFRDVTEEKRSQEALCQSEERFRLIAENLADLVAMLDLDGRRLYSSPSYKAILGDPQALQGTDSFEEVHPEDKERVMAAFRETVATGVGKRLEYRLIARDGHIRYIESEGSVIRDPRGEVSRVLVVSRDVTERREADAARLASEMRFRVLFEKSADAHLLLDADTQTIQECNQSAVRMMRAERQQELLGHNPGLLAPAVQPDGAYSRIQFREMCDIALAEGSHRFEWMQQRCDGQVFPVEMSMTTIPLGTRQFFFTTWRDITEARRLRDELRLLNADLEQRVVERTAQVQQEAAERRLAESFLRASEQRYRELVENANSIILKMDTSGNITFLNEFAERFFGYSASEVLGRNVVGTIVPETETSGRDLAAMLADIAKNADRYVSSENENIRKNGERVWISWTNRPVYSADGDLIETLCVGNDITRLKNTEAHLRVFRRFADSAGQGFSMMRRDGHTIYMNDALLRMLGYSSMQTREGTHFFERYPEALRQRLADEVLPALLDQSQWTGELALLTASGEIIPTIENFFLIRGEAGVPDSLANLVTDISRQKEVERELLRAKETAESADRIKSAFLATMSHELRTPLNSIIGFTGILLQGLAGALNDEQRKQLGIVQNSARHLLALINDVLDISKIEAGQLQVQSEPFDLHASIQKVMRAVAPLAEAKALSLSSDIAPDLPEIVNDQRRTEQILMNLLSNAIKFTERGEVRVTCSQRNATVVFTVADTGIGIPPDARETVFEPFRQVDSGIARKHEGTGLGLSICRRLLERMEGTIEVESRLGVGSVFTVVLPIHQGGEK